MEKLLTALLKKYEMSPPGLWRLVPPDEASCPGYALEVAGLTVPLFPWRHQRRFIELRNLVEQQTVACPAMCRFAALVERDGPAIDALLYRELDLVEWITGKGIEQLSFVTRDAWCTDGVIRLEGGAVCSIEIGCTLPPGSPNQGRHELVTGRGLACDLVVDTQVEQASVYCFTDNGDFDFTDVDGELFGLNMEKVAVVRAAFAVLKDYDTATNEGATQQDQRLKRLVSTALESDMQRVSFEVKGGVA